MKKSAVTISDIARRLGVSEATVSLTTVRQDIPALAEKTVELILKLIDSESPSDSEIIKLPTELIIRKSTQAHK